MDGLTHTIQLGYQNHLEGNLKDQSHLKMNF